MVEAASGLFRSGQFFGSHLVTLLSLGLLLALLAGLNAMKPAWANLLNKEHSKQASKEDSPCTTLMHCLGQLHLKYISRCCNEL